LLLRSLIFNLNKKSRAYMKTAHKCLKDDGLFLLHTIGENYSKVALDPWFERYIFPNSLIPSAKQISASIEKLFVMEDWHSFGPHYDPTLMSWFANFDKNWGSLKHKYGDRFYRMWKYYLLSSAGSFRARSLNVWQILLSKNGLRGSSCHIR
jgi:cyclopropane-fatty-acyl-phospholipid synthase